MQPLSRQELGAIATELSTTLNPADLKILRITSIENPSRVSDQSGVEQQLYEILDHLNRQEGDHLEIFLSGVVARYRDAELPETRKALQKLRKLTKVPKARASTALALLLMLIAGTYLTLSSTTTPYYFTVHTEQGYFVAHPSLQLTGCGHTIRVADAEDGADLPADCSHYQIQVTSAQADWSMDATLDTEGLCLLDRVDCEINGSMASCPTSTSRWRRMVCSFL